MSGPLRLVQVGAGAMGRAWLDAITRSADAELVGLVDLDAAVARAALEQRGLDVPVAADAVELARHTGAEAIVDVTVPGAHLAVNLAALQAGLAVLCEKPVTPTVRDALLLAAAAETTGRLLMVSQSRRYYAALAALRERAAAVGPVGLVRTEFMRAPHFGGFREEMDHPLLVDMAIHAFDVARYLLPGAPESVRCESFNPAWSWFRGDAAATATFEFDDGVRFHYLGSWVAHGLETSWNGSWRIGGRDGTASWDGEDEVVVQTGSAEPDRVVVAPSGAESIDGSLADFLAAVRAGRPPTSGEIHDNILTLAMVEAAVRSARTGERVGIAALLDEAWREALSGDLDPDQRARLEGWGSASGHLGLGGRPAQRLEGASA
ncbi:MAG: Gfo/Idh/MocA family protein [Amnibacterium sp.]